jgi:hypothetical protein
VSTGIHDAKLLQITNAVYLGNVRSYVRLLVEQCAPVVSWVGNTSPKTNDYVQKIERTQRWNLGVLDMLQERLWKMSSFVDVYNASTTSEYDNNIHMGNDWYAGLGAQWFGTL